MTSQAISSTSPELERRSFARKSIPWLTATAAIVAAAILLLSAARPERYEVIQTFAATGRGAKTPMGLAADTIGNVYGSTWTDGPGGGGTIFKMMRPSLFRSDWDMQVLSNLKNGPIGTGPFWSMIAQNNDLYGATTVSANFSAPFAFECRDA